MVDPVAKRPYYFNPITRGCEFSLQALNSKPRAAGTAANRYSSPARRSTKKVPTKTRTAKPKTRGVTTRCGMKCIPPTWDIESIHTSSSDTNILYETPVGSIMVPTVVTPASSKRKKKAAPTPAAPQLFQYNCDAATDSSPDDEEEDDDVEVLVEDAEDEEDAMVEGEPEVMDVDESDEDSDVLLIDLQQISTQAAVAPAAHSDDDDGTLDSESTLLQTSDEG